MRLLVVLASLGLVGAISVPTAPAAPVGGALVRSVPGIDFAVGQCTWYADRRRPDIVRRVTRRVRIADWDAYRWATNARRGGLSVSHRPRRGDIVVFPRFAKAYRPDGSWFQAGDVGHVAYVSRVRDGLFTMRGTHIHGYPMRRVVTTAGLRPGRLRFIHR